MTPDQIFTMVSPIAGVGWLLLLVAPGRPWVTGLVTTLIVPAVLAILYVAIVVTTIWSAKGGFATLSDVTVLFSQPWPLLAGWIHFLAFDLLIGSWEVSDARARGIPHLLVIPCLVLTFLFGPSGWLLYRGIRAVRRA